MLIMIDGVRSVTALAALIAPPATIDNLLAELESLGMISRGDVGIASPAPAPVALLAPKLPATPDQTTPALPLAHVRCHATRILIEMLGPAAEPLCVKIESTADWPEFVDSVKRARDIVHGMRGSATANQFTERLEAVMQGR